MELKFFINKLDDYLNKKIDEEELYKALDLCEVDLLDIDRKISDENSDKALLVHQALEVIDNIGFHMEEEDISEEDLFYELEKLISLQKSIEDIFPLKKEEPSTSLPETDDASDLSPSQNDRIEREYISKKSDFSFHPQMKARIPAYSHTDSKELDDIEFKTTPLYALIDIFKRYSSMETTLVNVKNVFQETFNEFSIMAEKGEDSWRDDESRGKFLELIEGVLYLLDDIKKYMEKGALREFLPDFIEELIDLNKQYSLISDENKFKKSYEEELVEKVLSVVSEEDYDTVNYHKIREACYLFYEGEIDRDELHSSLDDMLFLIEAGRKDYENTYISADEWTLEVFLGDKMLLEGLDGWEKGLNFIKKCNDLSIDSVEKVLDDIYEANKKLIINQYLSEYIEEQAGAVDKYSSSGYSASLSSERKVYDMSGKIKTLSGGFMTSSKIAGKTPVTAITPLPAKNSSSIVKSQSYSIGHNESSYIKKTDVQPSNIKNSPGGLSHKSHSSYYAASMPPSPLADRNNSVAVSERDFNSQNKRELSYAEPSKKKEISLPEETLDSSSIPSDRNIKDSKVFPLAEVPELPSEKNNKLDASKDKQAGQEISEPRRPEGGTGPRRPGGGTGPRRPGGGTGPRRPGGGTGPRRPGGLKRSGGEEQK